MKGIWKLAICVFLVCSLAVTAAAEEDGSYENAGQLYEAWVSGGCVPDYITAVISTDGGTDKLTFGVVEGELGERGVREILELVRDESTVTVIYQTYSRNELYRIQEELVDAYFDKDLGLVTAGVSEWENRLVLEVKTAYAEDPDTQEMIRRVTEQYGDAVTFRFTDSEIQLVTQTVTAAPGPVLTVPPRQLVPDGFPLLLCAVAAVLVGIEMRRRRIMAVLADGGTAAAGGQHIGIREIEAAIRSTEPKPSAALDDRIMESVGQTKDT